MKWVTRKPFTALSKRQQYIRLASNRALLKSRTNNQQLQQLENTNSTNNNDIIDQNVIESNQRSVRHLGESIEHLQESAEHLEESPEHLQELIKESAKKQAVELTDVNETNRTIPNVINTTDTVENINVNSIDNFQNLLRQCCLDMNLNHIQTKAVLRVCRTLPFLRCLPKDSRTLLKTGRTRISFLSIEGGVYWHIGFLRTLIKHLLLYDDEDLPCVLLIELSTDGLSLSKSNPCQYWPIQYRVINIEGFRPLIAGIYRGPAKPKDVNAFFQSLVEEVSNARLSNGILIRNRRIPFVFKRFVADAPARALALNHYGHNSKQPCSKCKISGTRFENRIMVYLGTDHPKRTNDEYINNIDESHQKAGKSPLADLLINPVTGVSFDVMHLVYLGVTVRFLDAWYLGKFGYGAKLSSLLMKELSSRYAQLISTCPREFARRPRPLSKYSKFKATELRHFLLYASAVILLGILSDEHYFHFLHLYTAMRILVAPEHSEENLKKAEGVLKVLITHAPNLYTPVFMSYNMHAIQHLVDDAREFGPLENCSAFAYENNMPLFKKNIRNHPRPLQQFARRLQEKNDVQHLKKSNVNKKVSQKAQFLKI